MQRGHRSDLLEMWTRRLVRGCLLYTSDAIDADDRPADAGRRADGDEGVHGGRAVDERFESVDEVRVVGVEDVYKRQVQVTGAEGKLLSRVLPIAVVFVVLMAALGLGGAVL